MDRRRGPPRRTALYAYGLGLAIGIWMGAHRLSGAVGEPILVTFYLLPKITLYPMILLIFGLTVAGKVTFGAIHGVLPVALLTMAAITQHPAGLPQIGAHDASVAMADHRDGAAARDPAGDRRRIAHRIYRQLLGVLLAEMFASENGLGLLIIKCHRAAADRGNDLNCRGTVHLRGGG